MAQNRCTLIIDGGWLLMSRFSVLTKDFDKTLPDHIKEEGKEKLKDLLARSIHSILNRFQCIDNIILTTEGGSWRKTLPIPKSLEKITYKGNRSNAIELDWHYIYGAFNEFSKHCKDIGITTSYYLNAEGDDWVWYWTRRLNAEGVNCIIWSSDNDLKQLVQIDNDTKAFSVWYNDRNGLWIPNSIKEPEYTDDIEFFFSRPIYTSDVLESLKIRANKENYIDPYDIILEKVICGDSGDNIKSILRYEKNNRTYKVSINDWKKIKEELNINNISDLKNHKNDIINILFKHKKYSQTKLTKQEVLEMIDYNIKLVWLNEAVIPEIIIDAMNQDEYKIYDINYIRNNYKALLEEDKDILNIFEGIV